MANIKRMFLRILLAIIIVIGLRVLITFCCYRTRIVFFDDRAHMEQNTGFDLTDAPDPVGYGIIGGLQGRYRFIKFQIAPDNLNIFLQKNGLGGKLTTEDWVISKAVGFNQTGMEMVKSKVTENWLSDNFLPTSAYIGELDENFGILVGRENPDSSMLTVYICKF